VLITHELDGLDQVDEIIVLDHGTVVQRGTHQQLILADGPYRHLHESQPLPASPEWAEPLTRSG
jgi:ATP-binding cassette subfamily C protein CydCD